jgi:hypothetical protein
MLSPAKTQISAKPVLQQDRHPALQVNDLQQDRHPALQD